MGRLRRYDRPLSSRLLWLGLALLLTSTPFWAALLLASLVVSSRHIETMLWIGGPVSIVSFAGLASLTVGAWMKAVGND